MPKMLQGRRGNAAAPGVGTHFRYAKSLRHVAALLARVFYVLLSTVNGTVVCLSFLCQIVLVRLGALGPLTLIASEVFFFLRFG